MWLYLLKRLLLMFPTLLGVLTLTFLVTQFVPGGPIDNALAQLNAEGARSDGMSEDGAEGGATWNYSGRQGISDEQRQLLADQYGFDQPPLTRYFKMLRSYLRFDLGQSYFRQQSVWTLILSKLPVSLSLGAWTLFLTYMISVPLGIRKAMHTGSRFDLLSTLLILLGYALPSFILGVLLIVVFGGGSLWELFPMRGLVSDNWDELGLYARFVDYFWHAAMPVTALVVSSLAVKTLLTRNVFLDEVSSQYVISARAKGVGERGILWRHVLRNALLPLVTSFPATFTAAFFTGTLLIETLFSLDGLGLLSYESINTRDYPVVLGTLWVFTIVGLLVKLAADVAYVLVDPRIAFDGHAD